MNFRDDSETILKDSFTEEEIDRLNTLREGYAEETVHNTSEELRRLEFVRWLVTTGRITDQVEEVTSSFNNSEN